MEPFDHYFSDNNPNARTVASLETISIEKQQEYARGLFMAQIPYRKIVPEDFDSKNVSKGLGDDIVTIPIVEDVSGVDMAPMLKDLVITILKAEGLVYVDSRELQVLWWKKSWPRYALTHKGQEEYEARHREIRQQEKALRRTTASDELEAMVNVAQKGLEDIAKIQKEVLESVL